MQRTKTRPFNLPYEPEYTDHRTSDRQRRNAEMLVHVHMNVLCEAPSIAPDMPSSGSSEPTTPRRRSPNHA